jgi:DNA-directed RNA polymerase specialized sigma24 family protein/CheY-like chemotaxis protein
MSISQAITPHLPALRRFARAISGSQDRGDANVVALLEALLAYPSKFPKGVSPKVALYRLFLKVWNAQDANAIPDLNARESGALRKLQSLTPRAREAFLLLSVEGFHPREIAEIFECSLTEVARLIATADLEIANQLDPAKILIVEDEALIALELEEIVKSLGHEVVGLARTRNQAIALAARHKPQLILSDIELADGSSGVDAANKILSSFEVPVIFVTGHAEALLTGTKPEPTFLIPKPFEAETVKAVISQALFFEVRSHVGAPGQTGTHARHFAAH